MRLWSQSDARRDNSVEYFGDFSPRNSQVESSRVAERAAEDCYDSVGHVCLWHDLFREFFPIYAVHYDD